MIHRNIAKPYMRHHMKKLFKESEGSHEYMENLMKKRLFGKFQFQFASPHFVDEIPYAGPGAKQDNRRKGTDHIYDSSFYVRKFLEPPKFKKLEIVGWEMPEGFNKNVTLREMVEAGMQYGHMSCNMNPLMMPYIYSNMDGTTIFDLVQTAANLNRACYYCMEAARNGATFFFSGTKENIGPIIKEKAESCGSWYADLRATPGMFTNELMNRPAMKMLKVMEREQAQGAWKSLTPTEQKLKKSKLERMQRRYHGMMDMEGFPDIVIVVDPIKERGIVAECGRLGIPVIALADSDSHTRFLDIIVAGNASGTKSAELFLGKLSEAISLGKNMGVKAGDMPEVKPEWDPWLFSMSRLREFKHKSKRQPWMRQEYGGYEKYKAAHPWGVIKNPGTFHKFSWND